MVLFAGQLAPEALAPVFAGKNSLFLALERGRSFPGVTKTVVLAREGEDWPGMPAEIRLERRLVWTKGALLESLSELSAGFDLSYFAWADCPFLDPVLAGALADRHLRYAAEYSYADGWPYGLAPELLSPGTAGILRKILGDDEGPPDRDCLFSVLQKDINAFDIETEISPVDLRCHRLKLCADSKRNLLLLRRFTEAAGSAAGGAGAMPSAADTERIILEKPGILRSLPNFFPVQVYGGCPQACAFCPYPAAGKGGGDVPVTGRRDFMEMERFETILEKITAFSGDAVIDLSLWGELGLHPQKMELAAAVLARPELALIIETSGLGWKEEELEQAADLARNEAEKPGRKNQMPPLSWIVSLDTADPRRYREIRGAGFSEAAGCAKKLLALFPKDAYVQAVRAAGAEDDIERFYRSWKEVAPKGAANIIIQKYDDFCGALPKRQASDLSPVKREPCWHIMRDMPVLIDGTVPLCREDPDCLKGNGGHPGIPENAGRGRVLGNVFSDSLETIWRRGESFYLEQCGKKYSGLCVECDEYYTYNF
jgi:spiro-SPASM protein